MIQSTNIKMNGWLTLSQSTFTQLPKWLEDADVSQVDSLEEIFSQCTSIEEIILPNWNVENVTSMYYGFYRCLNLTEIDISNWYTPKLSIFHPFHYTSSLHTLKWNHFGVGKSEYVYNTVDLTSCPLGTGGEESVKALKDTFVKNSFDRVKKGWTTQSFIGFNANTMALFTEEEIAEMTAKGYTIS